MVYALENDDAEKDCSSTGRLQLARSVDLINTWRESGIGKEVWWEKGNCQERGKEARVWKARVGYSEVVASQTNNLIAINRGWWCQRFRVESLARYRTLNSLPPLPIFDGIQIKSSLLVIFATILPSKSTKSGAIRETNRSTTKVPVKGQFARSPSTDNGLQYWKLETLGGPETLRVWRLSLGSPISRCGLLWLT